MRLFRWFFLAIVGIFLIVLAVANRELVTLRLLPKEVSQHFPEIASITVPVFLIAFGGIIAGLFIGFFWEWMREHRYRAEAVRNKREVSRLSKEVSGLKQETNADKDDVLALIE